MENPRIPRYRIALVKEKSLEVQYPHQIRMPDRAASVFRKVFEETDREMFIIMTLDTKHKIIGINMVSLGSLDQSIVTMRESLKLAVLQNASAIIHGHNHPSGDPEPSTQDLDMHNKLNEACNLMGIRLLDGIICGEDDFYSINTATRGIYASSSI